MFEISINDNEYKIEIVKREGNKVTVSIGDRLYDLDVIEPKPGVYSFLYKGKSLEYNFFSKEKDKNQYEVVSGDKYWEVEIIDAQRRYRKNRAGDDDDGGNFISTPMPGQVVKLLVKPGDEVTAGTTVIIISAMKMESEYKVLADRVIKEVLVSEGDNIDGDQPLITFE
ncbi:MAG: acetyl-CoA carboxylase biotin carboxyl carrier protein subunit [Bacteroidetes bacterium]|nr:MAG: acetyl-CoA carboxylase biotin carboxyl carrier protein subunit [Bacteroidota bacterium]